MRARRSWRRSWCRRSCSRRRARDTCSRPTSRSMARPMDAQGASLWRSMDQPRRGTTRNAASVSVSSCREMLKAESAFDSGGRRGELQNPTAGLTPNTRRCERTRLLGCRRGQRANLRRSGHCPDRRQHRARRRLLAFSGRRRASRRWPGASSEPCLLRRRSTAQTEDRREPHRMRWRVSTPGCQAPMRRPEGRSGQLNYPQANSTHGPRSTSTVTSGSRRAPVGLQVLVRGQNRLGRHELPDHHRLGSRAGAVSTS